MCTVNDVMISFCTPSEGCLVDPSMAENIETVTSAHAIPPTSTGAITWDGRGKVGIACQAVRRTLPLMAKMIELCQVDGMARSER